MQYAIKTRWGYVKIENEIFHPIAHRILERCDAVLRMGGASQGADEMVSTAQKLGLQVFYSIDEVPNISSK